MKPHVCPVCKELPFAIACPDRPIEDVMALFEKMILRVSFEPGTLDEEEDEDYEHGE